MVSVKRIFQRLKEKLGITRGRVRVEEKRRVEREPERKTHFVVEGVVKAEYKNSKNHHDRVVEVEFTAVFPYEPDDDQILALVEDKLAEDEYMRDWFFDVPWTYTVGIDKVIVREGEISQPEIEVKYYVA